MKKRVRFKAKHILTMKFLVGVLFAAVLPTIVGGSCALLGEYWLGAVLGLCLFGLCLDLIFNGSGAEDYDWSN